MSSTHTNATNATMLDRQEGLTDITYIDNATLLQVDATAIVGILIFLTLRQLSSGQPNPKGTLLLWHLTFAAVLPFALSAIFILYNAFYPDPTDWAPKLFAMLGFLYILIVFGIIFLHLRIQARRTK